MNPLPPESEEILRVLMESGTTRGFELQKRLRSRIPKEKFIDALRPLIRERVITASDKVEPETVDRVQFAPLSASFNKTFVTG